MRDLFKLNPALDRAALAEAFARDGRVQIRNVLTDETAKEMAMVLGRATPWGYAIGSGDAKRESFRQQDAQTHEGAQKIRAAAEEAQKTTARGEYAFQFAHYPIVTAIQQGWDPGGVHEILLGHLNAEDFLGLAREVTGIDTLVKADGQATLFAPGHYLGHHFDSHVGEGWEVAYVLNFAPDDWHPDWGGQLLFLDEDGDITGGYRPRFNALNLFKVPTAHMVSYVPPHAPMGRIAVTGWLRTK